MQLFSVVHFKQGGGGLCYVLEARLPPSARLLKRDFNQCRCVTEAYFTGRQKIIKVLFSFNLLHPNESVRRTHLCTGLSGAVGTHKLHKLLKGVLMVVVAYGGVGEVGAGLLDDRRGGEVQGRGGGTGTP